MYRIDYTDATDPSFEDITRNLPFTYTSGEKCIVVESSINRDIYLATDFGVFYVNSDLLLNYGSEWQIVGTDLPHVVSHGIEINFFEKLLRVGTFGRGSWK
ncbi:MAG: hypothetical protein IPH45_20670 [Bacteroidales bacterium]|nr:hypothetical protein [Bacteroidales bacterium]